jgi:hypothetical protein
VEFLVLRKNTNTDVMGSELLFSGRGSESHDTVLDEILSACVSEAFEVLLEVGLGRLASGTDCYGVVLIIVCGWACLEEMSSSLINSCNNQTTSKWSLRRMASLGLTFLLELDNHSLNWVLTSISVEVVKGFVSHELADVPGIGSEAREHHAQMVIDIEHLLLVGCEIVWRLLESNDDLNRM